MTRNNDAESTVGEHRCPNCGSLPIEGYDTNSDVIEYRCENENCRCMVFRA